MKKLLLASVVMMAMLPMTGLARGRVGVFVGPRFAPYGWYGWYGSPWGMYPYGPYFGTPNAGEVKLDTHVKDAEVFINGHFAGTVAHMKSMMMRPGNYTIEIRAPGREPFTQDIYVVAGKTMKLRPDLHALAASGTASS